MSHIATFLFLKEVRPRQDVVKNLSLGSQGHQRGLVACQALASLLRAARPILALPVVARLRYIVL